MSSVHSSIQSTVTSTVNSTETALNSTQTTHKQHTNTRPPFFTLTTLFTYTNQVRTPI